MNINDNIRIALFSIKTNLMRSLLTMLGIIIGVASVITIITVGDGGRNYIIGMIQDMGGSSIVTITVDVAATASDYMTPEDIAAIREIPEISYISPAIIQMGGFETKSASGICMTIGGYTDMPNIMSTAPKYGRFYNQQEYLTGAAVGVIDTGGAMAIFGTENPVGEVVPYSFEGKMYNIKIIGVMDLLGLFGGNTEQMMSMTASFRATSTLRTCSLMVPASFSARISDSSERYDSLYLTAEDENRIDAAGEAALAKLQARHNNQDRDVYIKTNLAQFVDLIDTVIRVFTIFIAAVSAISLIVGGIGVMNIMLVSVTERTREIGIRKAVGARTKVVLMQFLTESIVICFIGGTIGLIIGVTISFVVSAVMGVPLAVELWTIVLAVGFATAIGLFFGIYPAKRAADLPPIEALRKE